MPPYLLAVENSPAVVLVLRMAIAAYRRVPAFMKLRIPYPLEATC